MDNEALERFEREFNRSYIAKKRINIILCSITALLGIIAVILNLIISKEGVLIFRYLTIDGTIFTATLSLICAGVNIMEMTKLTEVTHRWVYYIRFASAVAEGLIFLVVMLSQLPVFDEHMHLWRYDMFLMHLIIPVITFMSFAVNDSPIGKLRLRQKIQGNLFVLLYAIVVIYLIATGSIASKYVPYFFLDVVNNPLIQTILSIIFIFILGCFISQIMYQLNLRYSWRWYRRKKK